MEENKLYTKGFNHGYTLRKYLSKVYNSIVSTNQVIGDYLEGFKDGGQTCEKEIQQTKLDELDDLRRDFERDHDLDRDST